MQQELTPMDAEAWAELHTLRVAVKGPDGFATWQAAAVAERIRRVKAEAEVERLNWHRQDLEQKLIASDKAIAQAVQADPLQAEMAALCLACGGTGTVEEQILQVKVFTDSGPAWKATTLEDWENHLACNRRVIAKDASHEQAMAQAVQP